MTSHTPLSKINIRRLATDVASQMKSNGRKLDPDALAERLWKQTRRCLLCRKPSYVFALYFPTDKADAAIRTGLRPGQGRTFAYGLCVKCYQDEGVYERVEEKIADSYLEEANIRAGLDAAGVRYTNETMPDGTRWIALRDDGPKDAA
jgi:hypothetical protein